MFTQHRLVIEIAHHTSARSQLYNNIFNLVLLVIKYAYPGGSKVEIEYL